MDAHELRGPASVADVHASVATGRACTAAASRQLGGVVVEVDACIGPTACGRTGPQLRKHLQRQQVRGLLCLRSHASGGCGQPRVDARRRPVVR